MKKKRRNYSEDACGARDRTSYLRLTSSYDNKQLTICACDSH